LRQAAFRAHKGSSSSSTGESTRFGGDFERLLFEKIVGVGLEMVGFAVNAALVGDTTADDGSFVCAEIFFVDADFGDPTLGDDGFGAESLDILDLDDDFLIVDDPDGSIDIWEGFLGICIAGGAAIPATAFGVDFFSEAAFNDFVVRGEAVGLECDSVVPVCFGVATSFGLNSGATSISDVTGELVVGAMNCPFAI
jgi:hypothetical protein